jgi:antitoxin CptB
MSGSERQELDRLRWQCRRGLLELDCIFEDYLEQRYQSAPESEQAQFRMLLDLLDPDLQAWILHQQEPPQEIREIVMRLRGD